MISRFHAAFGVTGFLCILTFWCATAGSEMFGNHETIAMVKRAVLWGMLILVPSVAATGATGFKLFQRKNTGLALAKKKRMLVIVPNGLLVLIPCAFYLDALAASGNFNSAFYVVQAIELIAGLVNLTLMSHNIRDGLQLAGRFAVRNSR